MGQPVKLSDDLVDDARAVVPFSQRSIVGQIEFLAGLGKSIEPLLRGDLMMVLQRAGAEKPISQILSEVDTAKGRKRPFPHYKPVPGHLDLIRRIEADGSEIIGRFLGREFEPVEADL